MHLSPEFGLILRQIGMIENIRKRVEVGDYRITIHAFERCVERSISPEEIEEVILSGEVIEDYMKDKYGPSCLRNGDEITSSTMHHSFRPPLPDLKSQKYRNSPLFLY